MHIGFQFLLIVITFIVIFAEIYRQRECLSTLKAYEYSALIQTLTGASYAPKDNVCKIATMIQAMCAYALTTGAIIWIKP